MAADVVSLDEYRAKKAKSEPELADGLSIIAIAMLEGIGAEGLDGWIVPNFAYLAPDKDPA